MNSFSATENHAVTTVVATADTLSTAAPVCTVRPESAAWARHTRNLPKGRVAVGVLAGKPRLGLSAEVAVPSATGNDKVRARLNATVPVMPIVVERAVGRPAA